MHMEYQVTHPELVLSSVFSGNQLNLGEHNDSTEIKHGQQQGPDTDVSLY